MQDLVVRIKLRLSSKLGAIDSLTTFNNISVILRRKAEFLENIIDLLQNHLETLLCDVVSNTPVNADMH